METPTPYMALTMRQKLVLQTICHLHYAQSRTPTFREIMDRTGISSPNGVMAHFRSLGRAGWIAQGPKFTPHNWRIAVAPPGWVLLPGGGIVSEDDLPALMEELRSRLESLCVSTSATS